MLLRTQTGSSSMSRLVRQRQVSTSWCTLLNPYRLSWQTELFTWSVSNNLPDPTLSKMFSKSSSLMPRQVPSFSHQMETKRCPLPGKREGEEAALSPRQGTTLGVQPLQQRLFTQSLESTLFQKQPEVSVAGGHQLGLGNRKVHREGPSSLS